MIEGENGMNIAIIDDEFKTIVKNGVLNSMADAIQSCIDIVQNTSTFCYSDCEIMKRDIIAKLQQYKVDVEEMKELDVKDFEAPCGNNEFVKGKK